MVRETVILTRQDIATQIDIVAAIPAIEHAMGEFEKGQDYLPPKAIYQVPVGEAIAACITGHTQATDLLSMKLGQERTANPSRGLPTTNSWLTAFDPATGELLMICDGTLPTMYRTAAAAAVSTKHLARDSAETLAVIGAGQLGRHCLRAVRSTRKFQQVLVYDISAAAAAQFVTDLSQPDQAPIRVADAATACSQADVLVTATNSRAAIVQSDWVKPGTHLCCMGSDLHQKIECEVALLPRCQKYADFIEHACARGEVSQAIELGVLDKDCYVGSLGQVINGTCPGRTDPQQITLYDGVGIGIQDTTIARTILDQASDKGIGTRLKFS